MRSTLCLISAALLPIVAHTQTQPAFEVASVKPTSPAVKAQHWSSVDIPDPGRLVAQNSSLDELIRFAYDLKDYQVSGPIWLNDSSEDFDVLAKAPPGTSKSLMCVMLQTLLKDRFNLAAHRQRKILPAYDLLVAKNGPTLHPADPAGHTGTSSGGGNVTATNVTMADFAYELSRDLKLPVFDQTGIKGAFDIKLHYEPGDDAVSRTTAYLTAIRGTLGLTLKSTKGPVDILVIDHIDKVPTEN